MQLPPGLKVEASECLDFTVNCAKPEKGSRLHLLVVGPGVPDQQKLRLSVLDALRAERSARIA